MTTTTDKIRVRVIALRDRARHPGTPAPEAKTALELAEKLIAKHGIDPSILTAEAEPQRVADPYGYGTFIKKYPCRFGHTFQHTIEELRECAAEAQARGASYTPPPRDPFENLFRDWFKDASGFRQQAPPADDQYTATGRRRHARATGSHAYCDHPATKAARAKCRKERGY